MSLERTILPAGIDCKDLELWIKEHQGIPWLKEHCTFLNQWLSEERIVCHTSGSTGIPKKIHLAKRWLILSAKRSLQVFGLAPNAQLLLQLPADKIGGRMMMVRALVGGFDLHILPSSTNIDASRSYDFAAFTPHQLQKSLNDGVDFKIKQIILGGSSISESLKANIQGLNAVVYETYGMTETASHIALRKLNGNSPNHYFKTVDGVHIRQGDQDELWIRLEEGAKEIRTKDVVKLKSKTELQLLGRLDSVINSGGLTLFPESIEAKLLSYVDAAFFVFGEVDDLLGERLVLMLEGSQNEYPKVDSGLLEAVLEKYERPKHIYWLKEFRRTSNGKIMREATMALLKVS